MHRSLLFAHRSTHSLILTLSLAFSIAELVGCGAGEARKGGASGAGGAGGATTASAGASGTQTGNGGTTSATTTAAGTGGTTSAATTSSSASSTSGHPSSGSSTSSSSSSSSTSSSSSSSSTSSSSSSSSSGATSSSSSGGTAAGPCDTYASGNTPCVAAHSPVRALYGSSQRERPLSGPARVGQHDEGHRSPDQGRRRLGRRARRVLLRDDLCHHHPLRPVRAWQRPRLPGPRRGRRRRHRRKCEQRVRECQRHQGLLALYQASQQLLEGRLQVGGANRQCARGDLPGNQWYAREQRGAASTTGTARRIEKSGATVPWTPSTSAASAGLASCVGSGPWVQADIENGLYQGGSASANPNNTGISSRFVTAMLKNNGDVGAGAQRRQRAIWQPVDLLQRLAPQRIQPRMHKQGAIVLGERRRLLQHQHQPERGDVLRRGPRLRLPDGCDGERRSGQHRRCGVQALAHWTLGGDD